MSELQSHKPQLYDTLDIANMSHEEYTALYSEYMRTVPEEKIMMISGMPIEIDDDPVAFREFVKKKFSIEEDHETPMEVNDEV